MAEQENGNGAGTSVPVTGVGAGDGATAGVDPNQAQVGILAQYVKDLSFENPNAPDIFQTIGNEQPKIDVNVNVAGRKVSDDTYEVELKLQASASSGGTGTFVVELVYAGLFGLRNVPDNVIQAFMLVQAPTILFPFARRVIADATRDGGYPPLLLDPMDFAAIYQSQLQQQGGDPAGTPPPPPPPPAS